MRLTAALASVPAALIMFSAGQARAELDYQSIEPSKPGTVAQSLAVANQPKSAGSIKILNGSSPARLGAVSSVSTPRPSPLAVPEKPESLKSHALIKPAEPKAAVIKSVARKPASRKSVKRSTRLRAAVNLSSQRMTVTVDGVVKHVWPISSGRGGYATPTGTFKPYRMHTMWRSRKYNNAKMPHSVFYRGGYAVHATYAISRLGSPASHGCVRLSPGSARTFFNLVKTYGKAQTTIAITGKTPAVRRSYAKRRRSERRRRVRKVYRAPSYGQYQARQRRRAHSRRRVYSQAPRQKGLFESLFD